MTKLVKMYCYVLMLCVSSGLLISPIYAQSNQIAVDAIYFENGEVALDLRLKDVTSEKVVLKSNISGKEVQFSRSRVLMAFSRQGNFLVITELPPELEQAKTVVQEFLNAPVRADKNDYLLKVSPLGVIPARIQYESADVINYLSPAGNAGSIPKSLVVAVLYKDGRHMLTKPAPEVAPLLVELRADIENGGKPVGQSAAPPVQQPQIETTEEVQSRENKRVLTEEEKEAYRRMALARVDQFVGYIHVITDKTQTSEDKDEAIKQAGGLFMPGATIEVTSTRRPGTRVLSLQEYLYRLKHLPYMFSKVEWVDTHLVQDLKQVADGTYEGKITGEQRLTSSGSGLMSYQDVVQKNGWVKLESYQKVIDGAAIIKWQPMLGNIRVSFDPK